jgi:ketosteroid isomerase-like protein
MVVKIADQPSVGGRVCGGRFTGVRSHRPTRKRGFGVNEGNREAVERYWQALQAGNMAAVGEAYHEDAVQEWPQSGERIVGRTNIMAINENYPGLPTGSVRRIIGSGDLWVAEVSLDYGGDRYEAVTILEMRDGRIARETGYFAEPFDAPQWRAQWVERM